MWYNSQTRSIYCLPGIVKSPEKHEMTSFAYGVEDRVTAGSSERCRRKWGLPPYGWGSEKRQSLRLELASMVNAEVMAGNRRTCDPSQCVYIRASGETYEGQHRYQILIMSLVVFHVTPLDCRRTGTKYPPESKVCLV